MCKNDELFTKNKELFIKNDELCIKNKEFCIKLKMIKNADSTCEGVAKGFQELDAGR